MTAETVPPELGSEPQGALLKTEQFHTTVYDDVIKIGGARVKYQLEIPDYQTEIDPVAIAAGYFGTPENYRRFGHEIASRGVVVLTYDKAHLQDLSHMLSPRHITHPDLLGSQMLYGVMKHARQEAGYNSFNVVGHSEGGRNAINAATHNPDQVSSVTLVGSAGLSGHSLIDMLQCCPSVLRQEIAPLMAQGIRNPKLVAETAEYLLLNPSRTLAEGIAVATCDIRDKVTDLRAQGIPVGALQLTNDHFFKLELVQKLSGTIVDTLRVCVDPRADHVWPQTHPKETADEVLDMIADYKDHRPTLSVV